jgi:hypothetical protein
MTTVLENGIRTEMVEFQHHFGLVAAVLADARPRRK